MTLSTSDTRVLRGPSGGDGAKSRDQLKFFAIRDVAEILDVSTRSVHRWITSRQLRTYRFGRNVRIAEGDLKAFVDQHRHE